MPTPEWLNTLPEDMRGNESLATIPDIPTLAKNYIETKQAVGSRIAIPKEGADQKELDAFYEKLGRPKEAKDYAIDPEVDQVIPREMRTQQFESEVNEFRETAHKLGMNKTQFNKIFGYRIGKMVAEAKAYEKRMTEETQAAQTTLRTKWGAKFDERAAGVQKVVEKYAGDDYDKIVEKYGRDPLILNLLGNMMEDLSEGTLEQLGHAKGGTMTPEDAQAEIDATMKDLKHAFHDKSRGKEYTAAKERMEKLYKWANPGMKDF